MSRYILPFSHKGSCWILLDLYCSVTMLRELGLILQSQYIGWNVSITGESLPRGNFVRGVCIKRGEFVSKGGSLYQKGGFCIKRGVLYQKGEFVRERVCQGARRVCQGVSLSGGAFVRDEFPRRRIDWHPVLPHQCGTVRIQVRATLVGGGRK